MESMKHTASQIAMPRTILPTQLSSVQVYLDQLSGTISHIPQYLECWCTWHLFPTQIFPMQYTVEQACLVCSNLPTCQHFSILGQLTRIVFIMLCWILHYIDTSQSSYEDFLLETAFFGYVPILDPILPRSLHDCFAWIDNFNPVLLQNNLFYLSSLDLVYLSLKLFTPF